MFSELVNRSIFYLLIIQ